MLGSLTRTRSLYGFPEVRCWAGNPGVREGPPESVTHLAVSTLEDHREGAVSNQVLARELELAHGLDTAAARLHSARGSGARAWGRRNGVRWAQAEAGGPRTRGGRRGLIARAPRPIGQAWAGSQSHRPADGEARSLGVLRRTLRALTVGTHSDSGLSSDTLQLQVRPDRRCGSEPRRETKDPRNLGLRARDAGAAALRGGRARGGACRAWTS